MKLNCNVHAASFVKGAFRGEHEDAEDLIPALGISGTFTFVYSYPLTAEATFEHILTPGMTGEDILVLARKDYEKIYEDEEKPGSPYGIWGHEFSDLYFETIKIKPKKMVIKFDVGS